MKNVPGLWFKCRMLLQSFGFCSILVISWYTDSLCYSPFTFWGGGHPRNGMVLFHQLYCICGCSSEEISCTILYLCWVTVVESMLFSYQKGTEEKSAVKTRKNLSLSDMTTLNHVTETFRESKVKICLFVFRSKKLDIFWMLPDRSWQKENFKRLQKKLAETLTIVLISCLSHRIKEILQTLT